jgi:single-strand DNA-binding protein
LQTRKWVDKSGADRYTTEVVLQGFRAQLVMLGGRGEAQAPRGKAQAKPKQSLGEDMSDEIPFLWPLQFFREDHNETMPRM